MLMFYKCFLHGEKMGEACLKETRLWKTGIWLSAKTKVSIVFFAGFQVLMSNAIFHLKPASLAEKIVVDRVCRRNHCYQAICSFVLIPKLLTQQKSLIFQVFIPLSDLVICPASSVMKLSKRLSAFAFSE